ncbi:TetR/AcrR family transcriptional regulator [Mycolicibacterium sp. S2-37]|uniref:TetR/AcrR family transcriptional regulator n=1 Tax=Mycolicibacterium sp. S2-37 TaxID=2810297 RepID=UPI001A9477E8|nr:TetR/AcrR family transcriptional regulator [Mycolicibacterium sp. S2-37]MBO0676961.1 TetR/AcrR family transcriptional regulator [Mycolicibacterium sp. S2-37]
MKNTRIARMPADRRQQLLRTAAAEFASFGYRGASLNRIIAGSGLSKSSFYYVMQSKRDLFEYVVQELIEQVRCDISVPRPEDFTGAQFWDRVGDFFDHVVGLAQRDTVVTLGRMFYSGAPETAAGAVTSATARVEGWVRDVLRVGRHSGALRADLPEDLQYRLVFQMLRVFDEWSVEHVAEFSPAEFGELGAAQFAAVRRVLEP